jgi:hypothetical protein
VNYYSCTFILWELSSPFLNVHWFCDKLGLTGSKFQLYNGITLIVTFFSCRLVWGTFQSLMVARDVWAALGSKPLVPATLPPELTLQNATFPAQYAETMQFVDGSTSVPWWLAAIYLGSNLTLNSLNFYWFVKMIEAVRKRFDPKDQEKEPIQATAHQGKAVTTGTDGGVGDLKTRQRRGTLLDGEEVDAPPPI